MGRKQNGEAKVVWRERLSRFESGNLTVAEFCRREGVSNPSFYQWRKRLRQCDRQQNQRGGEDRSAEASDSPSRFLPVKVAALAEAKIEFPNGIKIRIPATNVQVLRSVIEAASRVSQEVA